MKPKVQNSILVYQVPAGFQKDWDLGCEDHCRTFGFDRFRIFLIVTDGYSNRILLNYIVDLDRRSLQESLR